MPQPKVCKIEYATGCTRGIIFGNRFDKLIECCLLFGKWFNSTGNTKCASFNEKRNYKDEDGFNLATLGGELKLYLRMRGTESEIKFCPFCGARVEIIQTKIIQLKRRLRQVPDGYEETDVRIVTPPVAAIQ